MRPPVQQEARRSHLQPCPRCGEANGITAVACWKCDLQLIPDHLLAPRQGGADTPSPEPPTVEAEVPAEVLERIQTLHRGHDGPHTLPPLTAPADRFTANDPHFGAAWASPQSRLVWAAVGLAIAAGLLAWLVPRKPAESPSVRSATSTVSTAAAPAAAARTVTPPRAAAQPVQPGAAAPVSGTAAPMPLPVATARGQAPLPTFGGRSTVARARAAERAAPQRPALSPAAARGAVQREQDAARRIDAEAARRPSPVQAPCTPQVAALGLCDSN